MKYLWFCFLFLLCQGLAVGRPGEKYPFELGQVRIPAGTKWESRTAPEGMLHRGVRKKPEAYFLISISYQGSSLMDNRPGAMDAFVNQFANSLAQSEGSKAEALKFKPNERGCDFSFRLANGKGVYCRLLQGRTHTLVLVGVGASKTESMNFIDSFETMEGQFVRPLSREESANRAAAGYCWFCGGINLIAAPFVALLGAAAGYRFWTGLRNVLVALCLAEIAGATLYSYLQLRNLSLTFTILIALCAGLLVTGGIPIALVSLVVRKLKSKPA